MCELKTKTRKKSREQSTSL